MLILYTSTIFLGALLLFLVQPLVGRLLLPLLGGAPAVWNTALVFYQFTLLGGYAYAHFAPKWLGIRRQSVLQIGLLLLPLLVLPIAVPHGWSPPTEHNPIPWLLAILTVMVGLPFFAVSTLSPLLQRWFSASAHHHAGDPYFLYAASNFGSLLALVIYPVLVEPHLGLVKQGRWWTVGYLILACLTIIGAVSIWRRASRPASTEKAIANPIPMGAATERLTWRRRWRWILLAFVPCSLMMSVTTYVTSEVAPIPLLWVIPLGIYLLTFIFVFARRKLVPHRWMLRAFPVVVVLLITMLARTTLKSGSFVAFAWPATVHFLGLFVVSMVCHGELANDRPSVLHLTEFYLWMSVGGVLGGMFNALLAPLIFPTVIEYPITLLLACLLVSSPRAPKSRDKRARILDFALPILLGLLTAGLILLVEHGRLGDPTLAVALEWIPPAVFCLFLFRRSLRFALGVFAMLLATTLSLRPEIHTILRARSFFSTYGVDLMPGTEYVHIFTHGTTMQGLQNLEPQARRIPLLYYTRSGPLGETVAKLPEGLKQRVAAVGLGVGAAASYAEPGQHWTFYEIDPEVVRIASNPRYFTYVEDCRGDLKIVLGDARLSLQREPDHQFGFLMVDAFTSDTIPLHLVTREALALYMRKLVPDGVLAVHVTNRRLDLEPVFARLVKDAGLYAAICIDPATLEEWKRTGKMTSWWIVITRHPSFLDSLAQSHRWRPLQEQKGVGLWTDDYESVFSIFHWGSGAEF